MKITAHYLVNWQTKSNAAQQMSVLGPTSKTIFSAIVLPVKALLLNPKPTKAAIPKANLAPNPTVMAVVVASASLALALAVAVAPKAAANPARKVLAHTLANPNPLNLPSPAIPTFTIAAPRLWLKAKSKIAILTTQQQQQSSQRWTPTKQPKKSTLKIMLQIATALTHR